MVYIRLCSLQIVLIKAPMIGVIIFISLICYLFPGLHFFVYYGRTPNVIPLFPSGMRHVDSTSKFLPYHPCLTHNIRILGDGSYQLQDTEAAQLAGPKPKHLNLTNIRVLCATYTYMYYISGMVALNGTMLMCCDVFSSLYWGC